MQSSDEVVESRLKALVEAFDAVMVPAVPTNLDSDEALKPTHVIVDRTRHYAYAIRRIIEAVEGEMSISIPKNLDTQEPTPFLRLIAALNIHRAKPDEAFAKWTNEMRKYKL